MQKTLDTLRKELGRSLASFAGFRGARAELVAEACGCRPDGGDFLYDGDGRLTRSPPSVASLADRGYVTFGRCGRVLEAESDYV